MFQRVVLMLLIERNIKITYVDGDHSGKKSPFTGIISILYSNKKDKVGYRWNMTLLVIITSLKTADQVGGSSCSIFCGVVGKFLLIFGIFFPSLVNLGAFWKKKDRSSNMGTWND